MCTMLSSKKLSAIILIVDNLDTDYNLDTVLQNGNSSARTINLLTNGTVSANQH